MFLYKSEFLLQDRIQSDTIKSDIIKKYKIHLLFGML